MKKILSFLLVTLLAINAFAAFTPGKPPLKASEVQIPVGTTGHSISLYSLAHISIKDFEQASGKHLKWTERISFKIAQRELRNSIAPDGTIESRKVRKGLAKITSGETGFHAGGFFLGFLLGAIGVLITLLFKDDFKRNRTKWALIGWGIWVAIFLVLRIALIAA